MQHDFGTERRLERQAPPIANARLAMLLFVTGEAMVFVSLMVAYTMIRFSARGFSAMPMLEPAAGLPPILALLVCSNGFRFVVHALNRGNIRRYRLSMVVTLVAAATFLVLVLQMWSRAGEIGMVLGSNVRTGLFYLLTGAHALHGLGGILPLAVIAVRALMPTGTELNRSALNALELYWDFMILAGIVIYAVLFILR